MKKTLFFILLLALLPFIAQAKEVKISGDDVMHAGETKLYVASPSGAYYTYQWDSPNGWEKVTNYFDVVIDRNKIYITPKPGIATGIIELTCDVYDENGTFLGEGYINIVVIP